VLGWVGAVIGFNHHFKPSMARPGSMHMGDLGPFIFAISTLNLLIFIFGLCFVISRVKRLLAIRCRRMMHPLPQPRQN
jgi:hypothetical protein